MAIIPQYNAGNPATSQAPAMEQERGGVRVDARGELAALGELANNLARGNRPQQAISADLGTGFFRGVDAIGDGVRQVGATIFGIRERVAEAKNYRDVSEAQSAMDREVGEFEKWKAQNPEPSQWEGEWSKRVTSFGGTYMEGRDLSPSAKEGISVRLNAFAERQAVAVGVDAVKRQAGLAADSIQADFYRAIEAGDADTAQGLARYGFEQGFIPEDQAARMEIHAGEAVKAKAIDTLQNQKKTALLNGDLETARASVDAMPIREDEKELEKAIITNQHGYTKMIQDAEDILDPRERKQALEGDQFSGLRPSDRQKLFDNANLEINQEDTATVNMLKEEIGSGGVRGVSDLEGRTDYEALPERDKAAVRSFIATGATNDIADFAGMKRALLDYDPAEDPRGATRADLERSIAMRFDGPRANELLTTLEEATARSGPRSASERVVSDVFADLQKRYEAGDVGGFRLTGSDISERKDKNGNTIYTTPDPKGDFKDSGLMGTYTGRIIELSEQDRIKFKEKGRDSGEVYEDKRAKEAAFSRFLNVQGEIERKVKSGELSEADEITNEVNRLLGGELNSALESQLKLGNGGLTIPRRGNDNGESVFPSNPSERLKQLKDATGY